MSSINKANIKNLQDKSFIILKIFDIKANNHQIDLYSLFDFYYIITIYYLNDFLFIFKKFI
jgi:hypothetical protein